MHAHFCVIGIQILIEFVLILIYIPLFHTEKKLKYV